jgi:phenylpropionate dioxygenase-like ring-hydroxylating dioxygenase large terminal subunit
MTLVYERKPDQGQIDPKDIPYPEHLKVEKPPYKPEVMRVAVDRYFRQEYHDLEVEKIWKKAWQWAVREEDIPEIGDYHVYDVAELSFIVVRTGDHEFKAYWNSCLHRARKLKEFDGKRQTEFRCMFHGWSWDIHGEMNDMTCGWDFPGTREDVCHLPEAKTGTWGGFVFINPDPDCESLESFLGEMPDHFENAGHDYGKRWKQVHTQANLGVNWKVAQEAFLETWHVTYTHPQSVRTPDAPVVGGTRWDDFGNWMRSAPALPTDKYKTSPGFMTIGDTPQRMINQHWDFHLNAPLPVEYQDGDNAQELILSRVRAHYRDIIGDEVDRHHDITLMGADMVSVWPNFHPWGGFSHLVYRFRPYKSDPNRCIMDVMLMAPWPEDRPRPPPAPIHKLDPDAPISDAPELGMLGRVFLQDIANMHEVQRGVKSSKQGYVMLGVNNDAPVRHFHSLYDKWMGFEDGDYLAKQPD